MSKLTQAQKDKIILSAIDGHLNKGVSEDDTAQAMQDGGVDAPTIVKLPTLIQTIGKAQGWILTDAKIAQVVKDAVKNKPLNHFLDVQALVKTIKIPQLTDKEKQKAIVEFSGVDSSKVKASKKFTQMHNGKHVGGMMDWVREHPEFTAQELHNSGSCTAPNKAEYYDEVLAYRDEFQKMYGFEYKAI